MTLRLSTTTKGGERGGQDLFWLNLQTHYDLEVERDALGDKLNKIQPLRSA
ncbi:MAG: hypothetical protein ACRDTV_23230 [Mycobacterium sp.]